MKKLAILFGLVISSFILIAATADFNLSESISIGKNRILQADETITKDFNVKSGGRLELKLETGASIKVEGWEREAINVQVEIEDDDKNIVFDFKQTGSDVIVSSEYKNDSKNNESNVKVLVKVPSKYNVHFSTLGGSVSLKGIDGDLVGKTMGGSLNLNNLKGKINIETMGGSIDVKKCSIDGQVKTMGGSIQVDDLEGDLNLSTMGGSIRQNNVRSKGDGFGKEVTISTMGGSIEVDEALNGAKVKTMGGGISVNKAAKFIEAETMGGSIEIKEIDGRVKATTMGGDIEVKMVGNPNNGEREVFLKSMGGDITLTVPSELSMDLDIEIAYTKDNEDVKIKSDYTLKEERTAEWEKTKGSKKKYIYGKALINGGKNKVVIKTTNGDVIIKKG